MGNTLNQKNYCEKNSNLKVLHIISGDRWAGAEVQAYTLLKHLSHYADIYVVIMNRGDLFSRLNKEAISVFLLDENKNNSCQIFFEMFKIIRNIRPDIIHTHRQKENVLGSIAGSLFGIKSVRTEHGAAEFEPNTIQRLYRSLDQTTGKFIQKGIIAVSADLAIQLARIYKKNKIYTIVNGVDIEEIKHCSKNTDSIGFSKNTTHVGLVGRLEAVKRVDLFLHAAKLILKEPFKGKKWHFHIFGDGALLKELQALTLALDISKDVTFHKHRSDIYSCIAALDILVMTSDHEGLPMTILETIALGIPIVAHSVGGIKEIFPKNTGHLVTDHSAVGYKEAVIKVLQKRNHKINLHERFTAEYTANSTFSLYQHLLKIVD
ncbi:glycosyltransferase [Porticoccus sp. GXU_MW_L64]